MFFLSDGVTLTYDTDNRLISYTKGATSASYAYDTFGRRIKKTVNGTITYFAWDGNQLIAEYSATGVRQKRYAYLPNSLNPVQVQDANGTYNVHSDHLDTARFLTNTSQAIVWSAKQSAFGQTTVNQDPDGNGTAIVYNLRFPGQYVDAESGYHQNYFRDYDPATGRYIQSDSIGLAGGLNTYGYSYQNPIIYYDPNGKTPVIAAQRAWGVGSAVGRGFNHTWEAVAGQSVGGSIHDWINPPEDREDIIQQAAPGNVADTEIVQDYGEEASEAKCKGDEPPDRCEWLEANKGNYRPDQVKRTQKAWGCRRSRHS